MMKKIVIVLGVVVLVLLAAVLFIPAKQSKAPENQNPSPTPTPGIQPAVSSDGRVSVSSPIPNARVSSPLGVQGAVTGGGWFFEAVFPIKILDGDGTVLGQGLAQALGEWMTTGTVPFAANIPFTAPKYATGTILIEKDNPSGIPENAGELRIPIQFKAVSGQTAAPPGGSGPSICKPTGCSGEICSDQNMASTCIYRQEYACYKTAKCERQSSGECGWTQTMELQDCLQNGAKSSPPAVY
jgi:hypothetical protein